MTTGVRRGNDNEGPLVDVEPQEGVVGARVPIPFEGVAVEIGECQEVDACQEAHVEEGVESVVLVGPRVERPGFRWRLGVGAPLRVQRDRPPRR